MAGCFGMEGRAKKLRFRFYLKLEVDVWLERDLEIYYKRYLAFVCERFEKFLIFSINLVITRDFSLIEICRAVGVRNKGIWMTEKRYSLASIWS